VETTVLNLSHRSSQALIPIGDDALLTTLQILGAAMDADRIYSFENHPHPEALGGYGESRLQALNHFFRGRIYHRKSFSPNL
jgi:hypothetical protein